MNAVLIRYAVTAVASALIVGGLSALMTTNIMQSKVDDELKKITMAANRIEQQIPAAVAQDGDHYTGLGVNGLRLYLSAFGYSGESSGDFRVPAAPERLIPIPTKAAAPANGQAGSPTQAREGLRSMEPKPRSQADRVTDVGKRPTQDKP